MANLHVQPKRKNYLWVWIVIIVLIIAAAIYYFTTYEKGSPGSDRALIKSPSTQLHLAQIPLIKSINTVLILN